MQNLVFELVDSKSFPNLSQNWQKNKTKQNKTKQNKTKQNKTKQNKQTNEQCKKIVILVNIWPKLRPISEWMGHFFFKTWYLYGSTFQFPAFLLNQTWDPQGTVNNDIMTVFEILK